MIHLSQVAGVRNTITDIHEDFGYFQQTVETLVCNMFVFSQIRNPFGKFATLA